MTDNRIPPTGYEHPTDRQRKQRIIDGMSDWFDYQVMATNTDIAASAHEHHVAAMKAREREIYRIFADEPVTSVAANALYEELSEIIQYLTADGDIIIETIGDARLCNQFGESL